MILYREYLLRIWYSRSAFYLDIIMAGRDRQHKTKEERKFNFGVNDGVHNVNIDYETNDHREKRLTAIGVPSSLLKVIGLVTNKKSCPRCRNWLLCRRFAWRRSWCRNWCPPWQHRTRSWYPYWSSCWCYHWRDRWSRYCWWNWNSSGGWSGSCTARR